ncbi:hypothetical protein ACFC18_49070 [Streptomyces sp. NPDC056121]|uniref:hypothetical protein n=1 Tax=Streptomyces sp. NPDC056121 TaxID=3345718 RepID=UPI0035D58766
MVLLAVELLEFGLEVPGDLAHDVLGARQHGIDECLEPVRRGAPYTYRDYLSIVVT